MTTVEDEFQVTSQDKSNSATHTERGARIELCYSSIGARRGEYCCLLVSSSKRFQLNSP